MAIQKPSSQEYNSYYQRYIDRVETDPLLLLSTISDEVVAFFNSIPEDRLNWGYAEGKWTIKEVLRHMMDVERVMAFRALCIARDDKTSLPGFDHDQYAVVANVDDHKLEHLLAEYQAQRKSTQLLFKHLNSTELERIGSANGAPLSARAVAHIICGHDLHHLEVIREKYLAL